MFDKGKKNSLFLSHETEKKRHKAGRKQQKVR